MGKSHRLTECEIGIGSAIIVYNPFTLSVMFISLVDTRQRPGRFLPIFGSVDCNFKFLEASKEYLAPEKCLDL